jgi:hypothetical protein
MERVTDSNSRHFPWQGEIDLCRSCVEAGSRPLYQKYLYQLVESEHQMTHGDGIVIAKLSEVGWRSFADPDAFQKSSQSKRGVGENRARVGVIRRRNDPESGKGDVPDGHLSDGGCAAIQVLKPHEMYIV